MPARVRYPARLHFMVPADWRARIVAVSLGTNETMAEWLRRVIGRNLEAAERRREDQGAPS